MMISFRCPSIQNLVVATALAVAGIQGSFAQASESVDQKVVVELYYESQCPGCREMLTTSFKEAFQSEGFLDMADVTLVPYGNAQETQTASGTYEFECQHGPSECVYNTIEACALAKIDCPLQAFQYIDCIERSDESRDPSQDYYKVAMTCCKLLDLPEDTISAMEDCATGEEGIQLEHEAAVKTDSLDPPHQFVPYVVVNGEHDDDVQNDISDSLFEYVCKAYLGPNKSSACPGTTSTSSSLRATATTTVREPVPLDEEQLCYRDDQPAATNTRADAAMVAEE